jgi:hypothetical protein
VKRIVGTSSGLTRWIANRLELAIAEDFQSIGIINERGVILGAVGYEGWTGNSCEMHVAGTAPGWATPKFMEAVFHYPFVKNELKLVTLRATDDTWKFCYRLGFHVDFVRKDEAFEGDMYHMSMRKEDCRWLKRRVKHGQEKENAEAA